MSNILDFLVYRVNFAGKMWSIVANFSFLRNGGLVQASSQAQFRFGDVLSATPSARTPGSRGCREYHFFLGVLSARNCWKADLIGNSVCQSIADTIISNYEF